MRVRTSLCCLLLAGGLLAGCTSSPAPSAGRPAATAPTAGASASPSSGADASAAANAYRLRLRPTMGAVYDVVQPLRDAFDLFERPTATSALVRDDVLAASQAPLALAARRREVLASTPPALAARAAAQVAAALDELQKAATTLQGATQVAPGPGVVVQAYMTGEQQLNAAMGDWRKALAVLYAGQTVPDAPARDRSAAHRPPLSRGSWLLDAGRICGMDSATAAAAALPQVPRPAKDAATLRSTVMVPLAAVLKDGSATALGQAAAGLAAYGSGACARLYRPARG